MFKGRTKTEPDAAGVSPETPRKRNWLRFSIVANVILAVGLLGLVGGHQLIKLSDTSPQLCASCHVMQSHVDSYLNGTHLDSRHRQAGVECKECHDYPVSAEVSSAFNYVVGNYTVNPKGELFKRDVDDSMCLKCHISNEHVAYRTGPLSARNPHNSHWGSLPCRTCHTSHGPQIDFCSSCHDNGGQRMVGDSVLPDPLPVLNNSLQSPSN